MCGTLISKMLGCPTLIKKRVEASHHWKTHKKLTLACASLGMNQSKTLLRTITSAAETSSGTVDSSAHSALTRSPNPNRSIVDLQTCI